MSVAPKGALGAAPVDSSGAPPANHGSAGSGLRRRVEALGAALADSISAVLGSLPRRAVGPQALANRLGITTVTASRLLKAIAQAEPVATLQLLPGPNPLGQLIRAARDAGAEGARCDTALEQIAAFDDLIRNEAGDRGSLKAMLSAWLPEERREFEAQRRQSIFKALFELGGVSSELELDGLVVAPAADPGRVDLVNYKALLGVDRIRPDAVIKLGTRRLVSVAETGPDGVTERPRVPLNLDGEPALDGLHTVRLDEFCAATPAPLVAREFGPSVQYSIGPTGFGPASRVDLVIAELNRGELAHRSPGSDRPPYFFAIPEMPTRKLVFDLLVHRDVYPGCSPEVVGYDTAGMGPAVAGDPARELDLRHISEPLQVLGESTRRLRLVECPQYLDLLAHVFEKLSWRADEFRAYRLAISYPLVGTQLTLAFQRPAEGGE